jgi:hypothetical protein
MRSFSRTLAGPLAGLLMLAASAAPAPCGTLFTPSVGVRTTYDDSTLGQGESDGELLLSPALSLDWRGERTRALLKARLDAYQYIDHDEYSRENAQASADLSHDLSELATLRLGARWSRDHTVEEEFDESGLTTEKEARNTFAATPGLTLRLTERDDLAVDGTASLVRYEESGNIDYDVYGATATWSRALGDGLWRFIVQGGGQSYSFDRTDGETEQTVLTGLAGLAWKYSERLEFQAMGGASLTSSDVTYDDYPQADRDDDQLTFSGSLTGTWTDEIWRLTLAADRSESPSTDGELITRDRVRATFGRNMSERLYLGAQLAWYQSKSSGLVSDEDTQTWTVGPTLRYRLTEDTSIDAGYLYTREDDRAEDDVTNRNRVYLGVTMEWPEEW